MKPFGLNLLILKVFSNIISYEALLFHSFIRGNFYAGGLRKRRQT